MNLSALFPVRTKSNIRTCQLRIRPIFLSDPPPVIVLWEMRCMWSNSRHSHWTNRSLTLNKIRWRLHPLRRVENPNPLYMIVYICLYSSYILASKVCSLAKESASQRCASWTTHSELHFLKKPRTRLLNRSSCPWMYITCIAAMTICTHWVLASTTAVCKWYIYIFS